MSIEIRPVTRPDELAAVHRQRYQIYVEELGYPQHHADHAARTVAEPLDGTGVVFGAFSRSQLVGSVRVNYEVFGEYQYLYDLQRFGPFLPDGLSVVTKLMIEPAWRAGTLMARMGVALYVYTRDHRPQTRFCVIDCVPRLKPFFLRLGYRQIGPPITHPAAGTVLPMAFAVYDIAHFKQVGSPLASVCPRHECESSEWFKRMFCEFLDAPEHESDPIRVLAADNLASDSGN
jgi:hypothetical protein